MHSTSSSSLAFVPPTSSARTAHSYSSTDQLGGVLTSDGKRFRPEPLAMMPTGFEAEAFGFVKDVITAGVTGGTGDVIAQFAVKQRQDKENNNGEDSSFFSSSPTDEPFELDVRRSLSYATFAAGYTGAFQHVLFANLQDTFSDPVTKLAINQGLIIPLCYYSLLVWLVPKLRAKSPDEEAMLRGSINVMKMIPRNWAFWVPLQFIQFNYIPTEFQVIYCSCCGLFWNVCLSFLTAGKATTELPPLPETAMVKSADVRINVETDSTQPDGLVPILQSADRTTSSPSFSNDNGSSEGRPGARWLNILNGSDEDDEDNEMAEQLGEGTDMDVPTKQPFLDSVFRRRR